ncbi:MAG: ADP-forming succinate--CoA ligase subunit beta [Gemmatimonadetes bacterium]|uniref:Succinate--CoA ligase [ADP-forming] subunit beta n=1 Tax=Candidatus Kutchimonas denitrificans TaxID=3056748 RepID=A0AAE4ZBJ5_9BACT|nr:ADP-forming succinate--CoA ligase subunit beta [Gemmatimonadota bacterium]NIR75221.1 ADP-forming succinate--CoA ligase subunit beta [Candidatus Kutchimonas denitrificans]NIS00159.1 ADP-forming succinate--CoA ligase subunit beta [Gemmatimonadota bacterium]NIT65751.1 ADP-forming succinate--CoA ligase subunit beta [Gemmatimonadota bacterium]NIU53029.1 ADP-forming succinate--CoA ligase subunit beta [Gemmatimonadota bacterium]
MNIHEYQAKEIFREHGIPVPPGEVATTPAEAEEIASRFGGGVVVKAQVHAGGRGKAGGVKLASNAKDARKAAEKILGMEIKGLTVRKVLVSPAEDIAHEAYLGAIVDRANGAVVLMASPEGGIDIEEVAAKTPERIFKEEVDARYGLLEHQASRLAFKLYPNDASRARQAADIIDKLYASMIDAGASLIEINPLITTESGELKAIDAKLNVDDNELLRKEKIAELRDVESEASEEVKARSQGLTYIKLDGDVGCCVNGAGLAMATMDLVKYYGGEPANFLDIGGSSSPEKVVTALEIITADPSVKSILFNIFGGITRCDDVANGIVEATEQIELGVPITIRLTGTNEEQAVEILEDAGFSAMTDMDEAVKKAVELAKN